MYRIVVKARFCFLPEYSDQFIDSEEGKQTVLEMDYSSVAELRADFDLYLPYLDKDNCKMLVVEIPEQY